MPIAIYHRETNQVRTLIRDDHGGYVPPEGWELVPADQLPAGWTREPLPPEDLAAAIAAIKQRCREEILARYPDWMQANMTARAVELLEAKLRGWTAAEEIEADRIRAAWEWIKTRRAQSDAEEAAL